MSRHGHSVRWAPLLLLLLFGWPLAAQEPAPDEVSTEEVFFDRVDLTVVNIEVFVTDKKGNRITGLTSDDFEVFEDGRPVEVSNFYAVENGRPVTEEGLAPVAVEDEPLLDMPRLEVPAAQRLHLVVYVDNLFIRPFNRNRVLRAARSFLERVASPNDQIMVASFDRSLHIRQSFTHNPSLVEAALLELEEVTGYGVRTRTERRDVIRRVRTADSNFKAESHILSYADAVYYDVRQSVDALKEMVDALAGLPGRKAILYVSDGVPMVAAEDLFYMLDLRSGGETSGQLQANRYNARRLFQDLTGRANTNRVTFYTIEAAGLRSHESLSAENNPSGGSEIDVDGVRTANRQASIETMARDTGGLAFFNTNNVSGALRQVSGDLRSYYSLGYAPTHARQGRYYKLDVRVKRKGLRVRHREGFRDKTMETRISEGTLASLLYDETPNVLGIRLESNTPTPREDGRYLVPLVVKIPIGGLALLPQNALHLGRLRVSVAALDEKGSVSTVSQTPLRLDIPDADIETARGQHYTYAAELLMRPGVHKVAIGVHDDFGGETAYVTGAIRVGG